jgi:hypothetical protein
MLIVHCISNPLMAMASSRFSAALIADRDGKQSFSDHHKKALTMSSLLLQTFFNFFPETCLPTKNWLVTFKHKNAKSSRTAVYGAYKSIMDPYNKYVRPVRHRTFNVTLDLRLINIEDVVRFVRVYAQSNRQY